MLRWVTGTVTLLAATSLGAVPKVAVVYSAWSGEAFRHEWDVQLQALGWPFEAVENRQLADLVARLDQFDLVISAGVGNYENPQDQAIHAAAWQAFLERGGGLLVTDASYDSVLGLWAAHLGGGGLTSGKCAPYSGAHLGSREIRCDPQHPLLHVPHELPPLLARRGEIWAHVESWGDGWKDLATCADEKSLLVVHEHGRGVAMVTSYFHFGSPAPAAVDIGLLENLWAYVQGLLSGVAVTAFDPGPAAPGPRPMAIELRNTTAEALTYDLAVSLAYGDEPSVEAAHPRISVGAGATGRVELTLGIERRGPVTAGLRVAVGGQAAVTLQRRLEVPPMVRLEPATAHTWPGDESVAAIWAVVPDAGVPREACRGEILLDGRSIRRLTAAELDGEGRLPLGAALPEGRHMLALRLLRGDALLGQAEAPIDRHPTPRVGLRRDGTTLVDGKPFFPFGFYHVSWAFTAEQRLEALRAIAAGGFNTIHAGIKQLDEWGPFLDEADRLGVKVVTEFGVDANQVVERWRDKPAVLAWNPGDEPDGTGLDPAEMLRRTERFKVIDPSHPTYMTLCVPPTYSRYAHCADILAPDPYPIPMSPLSTVYTSLSSACREAAKHGHSVWGVLQSFGYPQGPWRVPTAAECRAMTYLALLAGVKGIIYYTYADGLEAKTFRMWEQSELWDGMKRLPAEMELLAPAILDGTRTVLESGTPEVFAATWSTPGASWMVVVNSDGKAAHDVDLPLAGEARALLGATVLRAEAGRLRGSLPPLAVEVWQAR